MNSKTTDQLARLLWDYHHLNHQVQKADLIAVLGSHDTRVAERGAELFLDGWAPRIVFSGGFGNLTRGIWTEPEAEVFAKVAIEQGVPAEKILIENRSTNTGENVIFTWRLLDQHNIHPDKIILIHKPYMERRVYATFKKVWPEPQLFVTSPQIGYDEYWNEQIEKEWGIHIMVGDLQRILIYPDRGFQIPQLIPDNILDAYKTLLQRGYIQYLAE